MAGTPYICEHSNTVLLVVSAGESKPCEDTLCAGHIGAAQQSPQGCEGSPPEGSGPAAHKPHCSTGRLDPSHLCTPRVMERLSMHGLQGSEATGECSYGACEQGWFWA